MPHVDKATGYIPELEPLRETFRPVGRIKLLLVGESPPDPVTGNFFYEGGPLTKVVQKAFASVFPQIGELDTKDFLLCLKRVGCFLDDISHNPITGMSDRDRNYTLLCELPAFVNRLKGCKPIAVVGFIKRIDFFLKYAVEQSGIDATLEYLPFPLRSAKNRKDFIEGLSRILREK
jgi:hypothetical protein